MEKCFVIQPFDKGKFDQRYNDSYKLAIEKAGLEPYRIDGDPSVRIPIDDIERGIQASLVCFADISIDNPNVWYELGYAIASGKDVVMVCSDERTGFPFDIQHRQVIKYQTRSKSDFDLLENEITKKINAFIKTSKTIKTLSEVPLVEREGLQGHEIALLLFTFETQFTSEDIISMYSLKDEMNKAGYTDIATGVAVRTLERKGMVETTNNIDWNNNHYLACKVTDKGEDWILSNQDKLVFRKETKNPVEDDLPF